MNIQHPVHRSTVRMIDIDGTICKKHKPDCIDTMEVLPDCLELVNKWYDEGDYIIFWTARLGIYYNKTKAQLEKAGFKFHQLITDKPYTHNMHIYDDSVIESHKIMRNEGIGKYIKAQERAAEILKEFT